MSWMSGCSCFSSSTLLLLFSRITHSLFASSFVSARLLSLVSDLPRISLCCCSSSSSRRSPALHRPSASRSLHHYFIVSSLCSFFLLLPVCFLCPPLLPLGLACCCLHSPSSFFLPIGWSSASFSARPPWQWRGSRILLLSLSSCIVFISPSSFLSLLLSPFPSAIPFVLRIFLPSCSLRVILKRQCPLKLPPLVLLMHSFRPHHLLFFSLLSLSLLFFAACSVHFPSVGFFGP